ncbi:MAG TPA: APC family permease [Ktedonobacterales bacterium]
MERHATELQPTPPSHTPQEAPSDGEHDKRDAGTPASVYTPPPAPPVQTFRYDGDGIFESRNGVSAPAHGDTTAVLDRTVAPISTPLPSKAANQIALPGFEHRVVLPGPKPGNTYVRRSLPASREFRTLGTNTIEATEASLAPRSSRGRLYEQVRRVMIGRRLATAEQVHERLTKVKALAVLSSDAISSVAYGTEASLGILITAGLGALHFNLGIAAVIITLMVIVGTSYWQTIHAYPHGGGSYIVARDNLGDWPGLIAAAALLIDYVLTVSVSVAAGVAALTTAVPSLQTYAVPLGVFFILLIMVVNLRGIRESGTIFAAPTYLFVLSFVIMIVAGIAKAALASGGLLHAIPPATPPEALGWSKALQPFGPLLILTAFASGCAAMTGVEAISNGVPAFKPPESHNASRTLAVMVAILATLYLGTTYLSWRFGMEPYANQNPTLDGQIAAYVFTGWSQPFYYVVQFATLLILVLAANTSFADFPRLSSILARDGFLPHQFSFRGDRLAFSTGIIVLSALSIVLLIAFNGSTDALINLYALGVFTAFTLSQSGMVVRWYRKREAAGFGWRRSMLINGVGAFATGVVTIVIMITKFDRGAWIVVLLVPLLVLLFRGIRRHYTHVRQQIRTLTPTRAEDLRHVMVVPIAELNRPAWQSLAYASSLAPEVVALHISTESEEEADFRTEWERWLESRRNDFSREAQEAKASQLAGQTPDDAREATKVYKRAVALAKNNPQLVVIESPYRSLVPPLVAYIDALRDRNPGMTVTVVLPEFVPAHWWERILHNQTAFRLKLALYSDPGVVVVNVPYHLSSQ